MTDDTSNILQRGLKNIHPPFSNFIRAQTTSSLFLLVATIVALWWANSDYSSTYQNLTHIPIGIFLGDIELQASLKHIINDGLMVIFFFLLGLEIKREVLAGDLALSENRRMLILCAVGGMILSSGNLFHVQLVVRFADWMGHPNGDRYGICLRCGHPG